MNDRIPSKCSVWQLKPPGLGAEIHSCSNSVRFLQFSSVPGTTFGHSHRYNGGMSNTQWWYKTDGTPFAYLDDEGKWFYRKSGEPLGYRQDIWIYAPSGLTDGIFR
jgi:hypothetical protein